MCEFMCARVRPLYRCTAQLSSTNRQGPPSHMHRTPYTPTRTFTNTHLHTCPQETLVEEEEQAAREVRIRVRVRVLVRVRVRACMSVWVCMLWEGCCCEERLFWCVGVRTCVFHHQQHM